MLVTVNSWPEGKCWIAFAGRLVAVGVGGMDVGVSVGEEMVEVGAMACVGGRLEGCTVTAAGAPVVAQAASNRTMKPNKSVRDILFIKISS
jgi:hypothetical protein